MNKKYILFITAFLSLIVLGMGLLFSAKQDVVISAGSSVDTVSNLPESFPIVDIAEVGQLIPEEVIVSTSEPVPSATLILYQDNVVEEVDCSREEVLVEEWSAKLEYRSEQIERFLAGCPLDEKTDIVGKMICTQKFTSMKARELPEIELKLNGYESSLASCLHQI